MLEAAFLVASSVCLLSILKWKNRHDECVRLKEQQKAFCQEMDEHLNRALSEVEELADKRSGTHDKR